MDGVKHRYAGCSLEIADHDVYSVRKRLNDVTYGVLIDLRSDDNLSLRHVGRTAIPDGHCKPGNVASWRPYFVCTFLLMVGEEFARVLLNEICVDNSDTVPIQSEVDREVANEVRFSRAPLLTCDG